MLSVIREGSALNHNVCVCALRPQKDDISVSLYIMPSKNPPNIFCLFVFLHLTPLSFLFQINFFIFIRIIKILMSKLRAHQMRYTDYKFR